MLAKILLIDDDAGIRNLYGKLLKDEGYEVYSVPNAKFAIETLFVIEPDLILLDINLPDFGGEMLFDVIRNHNPKLKVAVASVYPIVRQKQWIRGAANYFDKAQGTEALMEMIRATIGENRLKKIASI